MKTKRRLFGLWRPLLETLHLAVFLLVSASAAFLLYAVSGAPSLDGVTPRGYRTAVLDDAGEEILILAGEASNRVYVTLDEVPADLQNAFIAMEDERFYTHHGVDLRGILRALVKNLSRGRISQGASTITQQLIKNNLFSAGMGEETALDKVTRKIQEQYLALRLERMHDKAWILENYLNTINLGGGTWGVQTASRRWTIRTGFLRII